MPTTTEQSATEMAAYQAAAQRRATRRQQRLHARRTLALATAQRAAMLLKEQYGVTRVLLFGSLARNEPISDHSDIDLAVWGLDERLYFRVVARLLDLEPSISIDLLRAEASAASFLAVIEAEGICL